jgi:hypothetical protein
MHAQRTGGMHPARAMQPLPSAAAAVRDALLSAAGAAPAVGLDDIAHYLRLRARVFVDGMFCQPCFAYSPGVSCLLLPCFLFIVVACCLCECGS